MEATIYVSDDFKVAGISIKHDKVELFSFGKTCSYQTFHKTIPADKYTAEVLELIKLKEKCNYYKGHEFTSDFFEVFSHDENLGLRYKFTKAYKDDRAVFFGKFNKEIPEQLEKRIWSIIEKMK